MQRRHLVCALFVLTLSCRLRDVPPPGGAVEASKMSIEYFGLRTAKYTAVNLATAKAWYADVLGSQPYFDQPFYVGFNVGGFELGITPDTNARHERPEAGIAYWGVADAEKSYERLLSKGAKPFEPVKDVGGGVKIGSVRDPFGNVFGVVENPQFHFTAPRTEGPGR
jgi:predicted enzyme related to lactoylglutathione lyase